MKNLLLVLKTPKHERFVYPELFDNGFNRFSKGTHAQTHKFIDLKLRCTKLSLVKGNKVGQYFLCQVTPNAYSLSEK